VSDSAISPVAHTLLTSESQGLTRQCSLIRGLNPLGLPNLGPLSYVHCMSSPSPRVARRTKVSLTPSEPPVSLGVGTHCIRQSIDPASFPLLGVTCLTLTLSSCYPSHTWDKQRTLRREQHVITMHISCNRHVTAHDHVLHCRYIPSDSTSAFLLFASTWETIAKTTDVKN
jgi:hypothetical protein